MDEGTLNDNGGTGLADLFWRFAKNSRGMEKL